MFSPLPNLVFSCRAYHETSYTMCFIPPFHGAVAFHTLKGVYKALCDHLGTTVHLETKPHSWFKSEAANQQTKLSAQQNIQSSVKFQDDLFLLFPSFQTNCFVEQPLFLLWSSEFTWLNILTWQIEKCLDNISIYLHAEIIFNVLL